MRAFRFGVQTSSAPDGKAWRARARQVEDLGYSTLWTPDHFGDQWAPLVALTVAAEATSTLRVGALVFANDYRHPAVLAKELATLDVVSEGRVELGIGAGWMRSDYEQYGLALDRPGVRIERMEEGVRVIKSLWSEEAVTMRGRHYDLRGAQGLPRPVQRPRPPVLIGGGGRRVLTVAAHEADIVGFSARLTAGFVGPDVARTALAPRFRERVAWVEEAAGERFAQLELHCHTAFCLVGANARATAEAMAPAFGITPEQALGVPVALVGGLEEICESLHQRREEYGFSYWSVPGDAFEAFAPVVARLAGQ
ncbi:MAG: TIGR03621 family F420-dependent LLM class oxidoreductase [Actinomycetota bacterium]|nr:TIGR03621 family F420-dependent LLM class oxidoreductase [Actinomycetota bacterium]